MLSASGESKTVAVVVPMYKEALTPEEEISFKHLTHFLGKFPKYLMTPRWLKPKLEGFSVKSFDDRYFKDSDTYSDLLLSRSFYQSFSDYEYILIYQLDALVFSDQLLEWCGKDLDYIGAPWLVSAYTGFITQPAVGNGGLSLRRIEGFLKVFESKKYCMDPDQYWERFCTGRSALSRFVNLPRRYLKCLRRFNGVNWETSRWAAKKSSPYPNEDYFWSFAATKYDTGFRIAPVEEALRFSFEVVPRECFELNNRQLPFGCHGWAKYDLEFWKPYLLT